LVKIVCILGTRPEAIKMAPVVKALSLQSWVDLRVIATAQHREMLDQVLELFAIQPHRDLNVMRSNQGLADLTARLIGNLDELLQQEHPQAVLAQGDTTTVMTAALTAFYQRIPFGHVEAGLRTGDLANPFPEEMNRIVAGHLTRWHFAPTESARANLLREGIDEQAIHVTGNTVIDALLDISSRLPPLNLPIHPDKRLILVTAHRRENFGEPLKNIIQALRQLAQANPDVQILYPVHPNPNIAGPVYRELGSFPGIILCPPLDYAPFVAAMKSAYLIVSDSGGVQEEAPALGKPVLVLRAETERPEAVEAGVVRLIGTAAETIVECTQRLLDDDDEYRKLAKGISPYGDGHAAERIVAILARDLAQCAKS